MDHYRNRSRGASKAERGTVLVFVTMALGVLIGFAAWSTETGRAWQTKSQLQVAADSSALAGAGNLFSADFLTVNEGAARTASITYGAQHAAADVDNLTIAAADVEVGSWDMATETFTALPGSSDPDVVRAVRVAARRDDTANGPVGALLGRVLGVDSIPVNTDAIAYWGSIVVRFRAAGRVLCARRITANSSATPLRIRVSFRPERRQAVWSSTRLPSRTPVGRVSKPTAPP